MMAPPSDQGRRVVPGEDGADANREDDGAGNGAAPVHPGHSLT